MTKEEFIDKTGVANKTIDAFKKMLEKVIQTKREGVELYLEINKKFDFAQRVKVYSFIEGEKKFIGFGFIKSIIAEEDYGTIFYEIKKEDKQTKEEVDEYYDISKYGVCEDDYEFCKMLLEKAV